MVESAFEFADICRAMDFHNFLFSMKASNPLVMVQAYRLLAEEMYKKGWDYPLHLGVTEVQTPYVPLYSLVSAGVCKLMAPCLRSFSTPLLAIGSCV